MQRGRTLTARMSATIEWLARDECHALDEAGLAVELGRRLRSAGLPLDHLGLYLRTLHPEILGHTIAWVPDEPVRVYRRPHDFVHSAGYFDNPIVRVLETQTPSVVRLDPPCGAPWTQAIDARPPCSTFSAHQASAARSRFPRRSRASRPG
jgi:adenylate cyclase